jgi:hypothetical protein
VFLIAGFLVEKLISGEVEKEWQRLSGFFSIGQSLANPGRYLFRGEGEK